MKLFDLNHSTYIKNQLTLVEKIKFASLILQEVKYNVDILFFKILAEGEG